MKVFYPIPAEKISSYIQAILVIENERLTSPFLMPLFANGTPTLLFSTAIAQIGGSKQNLILFGQTVIPEQLLIEQNFKLVAYFLKPYALGALFNISASELTDHPIGLDLLTGKFKLQEQLLNTATTEQIMRLIDNYLYDKITAIKIEDKRLNYAAEKIACTSNKIILTAVQRELYLTEKTFQRLFDRHIGIPPNLFRRVNQFNRAFKQINEGNYRNLSSVAYHNDYSDQSHFIRSFKEFTRISPSEYLRARQGV